MALSDLSSIQLSRLVELIKEKEVLQTRLVDINAKLAALEMGEAEKPKKSKRRRGSKARAKTSDSILAQLKNAGRGGMSVKDIAAATGAKAPSVAVWLYTAGKKVKGLRKVARGRFAYKPAA